MKICLTAAAISACCLMAVGCSSSDKSAASSSTAKPATANMSVVNANCPISGHAVDPAADTVSYKGKSVGFCCDGCQSKWAKMTDAEKDAFMKKQMAAK